MKLKETRLIIKTRLKITSEIKHNITREPNPLTGSCCEWKSKKIKQTSKREETCFVFLFTRVNSAQITFAVWTYAETTASDLTI